MELTVISGKGGTGKTTIAMALSRLFGSRVMSDCDVDAANLYLYQQGSDIRKEYFYAGKTARINERFCTQCGECERVCRFDAVKNFVIDPYKCEGCGACRIVCPTDAIDLKDKKAADSYITKTPGGHLTRAQMEIGSDGSGKLITQLRKTARSFAEQDDVIIIDGSPGIGCPVISSITGADLVLIVTEPTLSGKSDFERIAQLCTYFGIRTFACINKYDINEQVAQQIKKYSEAAGIELIGRIPYDETVIESINSLKPITDYKDSTAAAAIRQMFDKLKVYTDKIINTLKSEEDEL